MIEEAHRAVVFAVGVVCCCCCCCCCCRCCCCCCASLLGDALLAGLLRRRLAQRGGGTPAGQLPLFLLLLSERQQFSVFVGIGLGLGDTRALLGLDASGALKDDRRDEALDLGSFRLRLLLSFLQLQRPPDDVLSDIVIFVEVEQLADFARPLGSQAARNRRVGQSWNIGVALLHDDEVENGQIRVDDTSSDAPAMTLSRAPGSVAGVLGAEEKADATVGQHSLHHRESLLVISAADAENVALPLIPERVAGDFLRHLLVEEDAEFAVILDLDQLLASRRRIGNV